MLPFPIPFPSSTVVNFTDWNAEKKAKFNNPYTWKYPESSNFSLFWKPLVGIRPPCPHLHPGAAPGYDLAFTWWLYILWSFIQCQFAMLRLVTHFCCWHLSIAAWSICLVLALSALDTSRHQEVPIISIAFLPDWKKKEKEKKYAITKN